MMVIMVVQANALWQAYAFNTVFIIVMIGGGVVLIGYWCGGLTSKQSSICILILYAGCFAILCLTMLYLGVVMVVGVLTVLGIA